MTSKLNSRSTPGDRASHIPPVSVIFGRTAAMRSIRQKIEKAASSGVPILIQGDSGTGKGLLALFIHSISVQLNTPFIKVNCAAIPGALLESELFGYEKGAFTGALKSKQGLFQAASGGTIFLDEIGELPQEMQAKLLRVLQEKEVRPVGSNDRVKVDVRVIAATNRDLEAAYKAGTFRKDLFFRLNVVTIHLPPLRERKSDIPSLVRCFLLDHSPDVPIQVLPAAMRCLLQYDWPGNVRELQNCIERAIALGNKETIDLTDLPPAIRDAQPGPGVSLEEESVGSLSAPATDLEDIERMTIQRVFEQVGGDKVLAGRMLGISRATLYRKLKRYNISLEHPNRDSAGTGQ